MKSRSFVMLFLLSSSFMYADNSLVDLSMTQKEKEATGINRMSPQQKKAFEQWLDVWTRTVIAHSSSYHPSLTLSNWVLAWRMEQQKEKRIEKEDPQAFLHTLFRNKNGEQLEFVDGSIWDIVVFDQFAVSMWKRGDKITISPNKSDLTRPFTLLNTLRNEQAGAKLVRKASPNGQRPKDPPSYFEGSNPIEVIGFNGSTVVLHGAKTWTIAPLDQVRVQNNWKIADRIRVTHNNDTLYPSRLLNLDSGDSAAAIEG